MSEGLGTRFLKGSAWMVAMRWSMRLMGLASMVFVARLLVPADFGIFAIAMTFIGLVNVLTEIGSDLAIIRHPDPQPRHYDTAWTFNVLIHTVSALFIALSSPLAVHLYKDPRYEGLLHALALSILIGGFNNIGIADFRRNMEFNKDFRYNVAVQLVGVTATLVSAYLLRSYWALVIGSLSRSVTGVLLSYLMHSYRPRFSLSAKDEMFSFSFWTMFRSFVIFIVGRGDQLIIGAFFGPTEIAFYAISGELAGMAVYELLHPIGRALLPSLSAMQEKGLDARNIKKIFNGVATLAMGTGVGLSAVATPAITLVYGHNFAPAGPMLAIMALMAAVSGFGQPVGQFLVMLGRMKDLALLYATQGVVLLIAAYVLSAKGVDIFVIVWMKLIVEVVAQLRLFYLLKFLDNMNWKDILAGWVRPVSAAAFMYGVITTLMKALVGYPPGVQLALLIPVGAFSYSAVLFVLWYLMNRPSGIEEEIFHRFWHKTNF